MPAQAWSEFFTQKSTIGRTYSRTDTVPTQGDIRALPAPVRWMLAAVSRVAPGPAAALARRIFLKPQRFRAPLRELWWETDAEAVAVPMPGSPVLDPSELRAWQWGSAGPTVVLIHGWGGRGLQLGAFARPLVDAGFRVLAVDLPAHGRSPGRSTSLPEAARAVRAVVEYAADQPGGVHGLVAHSFGCAATAVALAGGSPVQRLVFVAPPSDLDGVTRRFAEITGFSSGTMARMRTELERRFGFTWADLHPRRLVPKLDAPLLVIHDIGDQEVAWTQGQRLAELAVEGRLHLTSGLGHFRLLRDERVLSTVRAFLLGESAAHEAA